MVMPTISNHSPPALPYRDSPNIFASCLIRTIAACLNKTGGRKENPTQSLKSGCIRVFYVVLLQLLICSIYYYKYYYLQI